MTQKKKRGKVNAADFRDGCGHRQAVSLEPALSEEEHHAEQLRLTVCGDELTPFRCTAGTGAWHSRQPQRQGQGESPPLASRPPGTHLTATDVHQGGGALHGRGNRLLPSGL